MISRNTIDMESVASWLNFKESGCKEYFSAIDLKKKLINIDRKKEAILFLLKLLKVFIHS